MTMPKKQSGVAKVITYRIAEKEKKILLSKWGSISKFFNYVVEKEIKKIEKEKRNE